MMGRITIGLVLVLIGWIVSSVNIVMWSGDASSAAQAAGFAIKSIGLVVVAIAMLQGALQRAWFSDMIRLGMLISVGLLVIGL